MRGARKYVVVDHVGEFYVNNPVWNDTPSRFYAGPFSTRQEAQERADACNRNATARTGRDRCAATK